MKGSKTSIIGRPPLYEEAMERVVFRLPKTLLDAAKRQAKKSKVSLSVVLREWIEKGMYAK